VKGRHFPESGFLTSCDLGRDGSRHLWIAYVLITKTDDVVMGERFGFAFFRNWPLHVLSLSVRRAGRSINLMVKRQQTSTNAVRDQYFTYE
jgi:hypothetical protein